jgi:hypothetical protein
MVPIVGVGRIQRLSVNTPPPTVLFSGHLMGKTPEVCFLREFDRPYGPWRIYVRTIRSGQPRQVLAPLSVVMISAGAAVVHCSNTVVLLVAGFLEEPVRKGMSRCPQRSHCPATIDTPLGLMCGGSLCARELFGFLHKVIHVQELPSSADKRDGAELPGQIFELEQPSR